MADFAAHLWQSLREIQRMENTFVVSYDLHTCQAIMQRGIPCFLDRWSLQPSQLPGKCSARCSRQPGGAPAIPLSVSDCMSIYHLLSLYKTRMRWRPSLPITSTTNSIVGQFPSSESSVGIQWEATLVSEGVLTMEELRLAVNILPDVTAGQYGKEVPHWYSKYSWGLKLLEWGYTAVFVEMDMVFSSDPLPYFKKNLYDLEGLSDWRLAEVPDPKAS